MADLDREIARVWAVADTDGNGFLATAEVAGLLAHLRGGHAPQASEVEAVMARLDASRDGVVSFTEFSNAMRAWLGDAGGAVSGGSDDAASLRASAHRQIASFFGEFTGDSLLEAAATSIFDELRDDSEDHFGGGWVLTHGSLQGTLVRLSPWGDSALAATAEARAAALVTCEESVRRLPEVVAALASPAAAASWLGAVSLVHRLLAVSDLFDGPSLRGPLRATILLVFTRVQELGIPAALLRLIDPGQQTAVGDVAGAAALDAVRAEAMLALARFSLGPRLPHTPRESPWHPSQVWRFGKSVIIANDGRTSGIAWLQHYAANGASAATRAAAAVLLATLATRNPETHAVVAMQSGTPALLVRLIQAPGAPLEVLDALFACLCVCAGDTLPPGTVSSPVLQHHLGGADLLNLLAFSVQRFNTSGLAPGTPRSTALLTISVRTHVLTALACILPLLNCAANWANARPILDCLVDAAAVTVAQIIALQRLESGGGGPGTPPRGPVRQGSGSLLTSAQLPPGSDPVLLPALAGMLQVTLRAIRYVIASNGALELRPDAAAAAGVGTVARYLTCRTPLLETIQTVLVQLSPRSDALRVSALALLDPLVTAGEAAPLALHAGLVNCLQQALASEELQGRAAAVVLRLCCHAQAREYVGGLVTNGLVTALTATLASVRHPDDVIVETYATLQRVYDFAFIRDVMQALGSILVLVRQLSAEEVAAVAASSAQAPVLARQVEAAFTQRLVATYGLSLVAALQTALTAIYEDKRRTLPLHVQALSAPRREVWLGGGGGAAPGAADLFGACAGVDPARGQAEALARALLGDVVAQHQFIVSSVAESAASRAILTAVAQLQTEVLGADAQLNAAAGALLRGGGYGAAFGAFQAAPAAPAAPGAFGAAAPSSLFRASVAALEAVLIPVAAAVPPGVAAAVPGGPMRHLCVRRGAPVDAVRAAVREAFGLGDPRLDVAFAFLPGEAGAAYPGGVLLPLAAQGVLEAAHRARETRGLLELPLVVFDANAGVGAAAAPAPPPPAAAAGALFSGFTLPAARAPAPPVLRPALAIPSVDLDDESGGGGDSPMPGRGPRAAAAPLPPYAQAVAALRATHGDAVVVDEAALQRLHVVFAQKAAAVAGTAAGASATHLSRDEFVSLMGQAAGTPPAVAALMFSAMDADGSGAVSFEEMAVGLAVIAKGDLGSRLRLALSAFDHDKNGTMSASEIASLIRYSTGMAEAESAALAGRLLATYDLNGDGGLDANEMSVAVRAHPELLAAFQWVPGQ